ncbi:MAG: efflux RND transporter periplasmic adaptor subunit [Myxococcota bacterium]
MARRLHWLLPLSIIVLGLFIARGLIAIGPTAERRSGETPKPVVEYLTAELEARAIPISATGFVEAAEAVSMIPEVSGRVAWRSPKLSPGGRFLAGELIARLESSEYELAVEEERARVQSAALDLELEKSRGAIAAQEWHLLHGNSSQPNPLALRTPQQETAKVALESAKSGLRRTQLSLERTELRAPFDATVVSEDLALGQRVGPGAPVAELIGTGEFRVRVGVRLEDLRNIDIPGTAGVEEGSKARVVQQLSDGTIVEREGRVFRLVDRLSSTTRRAQLLVSVRNPLERVDGLPLLVGAFVEVVISGRVIDGLTGLASSAIHNGDEVWSVENDRLKRSQIRTRFVEGSRIYVSGLPSMTAVVLTTLSNPTDGMVVDARPATLDGQAP